MPAANMIAHDPEAGRLYLECGTPLCLDQLRVAVNEAHRLALGYESDIGAYEEGQLLLGREEPRIMVRRLDAHAIQPLTEALAELSEEIAERIRSEEEASEEAGAGGSMEARKRGSKMEDGGAERAARRADLRTEGLMGGLELMALYFGKISANKDFRPNMRTRDVVWRLLKVLKGRPGSSNYNTPDRDLRRRLFSAGRALWSCMYNGHQYRRRRLGIGLKEGFLTFVSYSALLGIMIFFGVPFVTLDVVQSGAEGDQNGGRDAWITAGIVAGVALFVSAFITVSRFVRQHLNLYRLQKEVLLVADASQFTPLCGYLQTKERIRRSLRFNDMSLTWQYLGLPGSVIREVLIKKMISAKDFSFQLAAAAIGALIIEFQPFGESTFKFGDSDMDGSVLLSGSVYAFLMIVVIIVGIANYFLVSQLLMVVPSDPTRVPTVIGVIEDLESPFLFFTSFANGVAMVTLATAAYLIATVNFRIDRIVSSIPVAVIIGLFYLLTSRVKWLHAQVKLDEVDLD